MNSVLFSHNTDDWKTPSRLYKHFIDHGCFDPCPYKCSTNNLGNLYTNKSIFINPPYSDIKNWCLYAEFLCTLNNIVYLLIPARTDTTYFHHLRPYIKEIWFFEKRLKFNDTGSAPFPSILITLDCHWFPNPIIAEFGNLDVFISRGFIYES